MPDLRLVGADTRKLLRRPGMLAMSVLLSTGAMLIGFGFGAVQHSRDPAEFPPAGGADNFQDALGFLLLMALVVGSIVGSTAGTQDTESGVFRDLAATGRSRLALFASRVAGALAVVLPILLLASAVHTGLSVALADSLPTPTGGDIAAGAAAVLAAGLLSTAVAVGLSALVGSRGTVIGVMLAFLLAVQPIAVNIASLGVVREILPSVALNRIGDVPMENLQVSLATAVLAVALWSAAALALGAWRTRTREI